MRVEVNTPRGESSGGEIIVCLASMRISQLCKLVIMK